MEALLKERVSGIEEKQNGSHWGIIQTELDDRVVRQGMSGVDNTDVCYLHGARFWVGELLSERVSSIKDTEW